MKRFTLLLLSLCMLPLIACADEDRPIEIRQLPSQAQQFIATHFANLQVAFAKIDHDLFFKDYEVIFVDGTQVKFNGKGLWQEVSLEKGSVPAAIIPPAITSKIEESWPQTFIKKIEKDRSEYDVTLSNNFEITFNSQFNIIDYDN